MAAAREALLLGLLHGPLELLPVSSSAHVAAIPALLDWEVDAWSGAARKELEVALHAGTAVALGWLLLHRRLPVLAAPTPPTGYRSWRPP
jgi:undecaprenyl-diphosphatase